MQELFINEQSANKQFLRVKIERRITILCEEHFRIGPQVHKIDRAISKLLEFLFKKYEVKTYFGVMGFIMASIITIFTGAEGLVFSVPQLLIGLVLLGIGFTAAYKLGE